MSRIVLKRIQVKKIIEKKECEANAESSSESEAGNDSVNIKKKKKT